jgi:serine/threonine-protein kinase
MTPKRWQQVRAIFDEAVEIEPTLRPEFVRERCGEDQNLRKEVESLLASHRETGSDPANWFKDLADWLKQDDADRAAMLPDRYQILGELGRGGMGIVYKACDRETGEVLALKILKREIAADAQIIGRLKNELLLAHRISHRNIARLYEFHRAGDTVFLSMEYVEGESLRAQLERTGKLDVTSGLEIARQIGAGLAEAHRQSIAHRDLKPENIMLCPGRDVKVMDFGISRSYAANPTATGSIIGTPAYMAPEQIEGLADNRTDIYAFGLTLYEIFTGTAAFRGDTPIPLLLQQIRERPKPPRELAPELPVHVEQAILRCLEKAPADRFQSVEDLLRALEGEPIPKARKPLKLALRLLGATVFAVLMVATSIGAFWLLRGGKRFQPVDNTSIAVLPFADLSPERNQEYFSDGLAEELTNALSKVQGLRVVARTSSFQFRGKGEDLDVIGRKLNVSAILEGSVRKQGNRVRVAVQLIKTADRFHIWSETFDREMNDIFAVQAEIAAAVTGALKGSILGFKTVPPSQKTSPEAYNAYLQGRYFHGNRENLEKAARYFDQAIRLDPRYAPAWARLSECRSSMAGAAYIPREDGYRQARETVERALALDPNLGYAYSAMGDIQMSHDWDWTAADTAYKRALELDPSDAGALRSAGWLALVLGRLDEGAKLYRRAIEIDPLNPNGHKNLGTLLYCAGHQQEAAAALQKALELNPAMDLGHALLSLVCLEQSDPQRALAESKKEKHPILRLSASALAYQALGRKPESDASLAELIAAYKVDGPYQIAEVYAFRREADRAFEWLERAYQQRDPGLSEMKADPLLQYLRRDLRYSALLKKMRLPL